MKPKILIVDDKSENLLALERLLVDIDVDIIRAESGNEALARTLENDFSLVLMDVQMPEMDGFETMELLREQEKTRYLPVIFVSAIFNDEAHLIRGVESGAVDFIVKPIVPELLIGKVKIFLELYSQKIQLEKLARDRRARESTFRRLAEGLLAGGTDQEIYNYIVTTCAAIFKTEHAVIGRLIDGSKIKTLAYLHEGRLSASVTYELKGTPCEEANKKGVCVYPSGVRHLFPHDHELEKMSIEGYLGIVLRDSKGKTIGVLNAFSRKSLQLPDYSAEVLEIIASRASAVLANQEVDESKKQLQERLQQAQKMEAIGTLAGGIAHDFNNILTPIMGYTELASQVAGADKQLHEHLDRIMEAANRAKELVHQILTFSRQSSHEQGPLKIELVVKEALKLLRSSIPTTIKIESNIGFDCGMVNADPTQIHQVVMNLCTNAYHAMRNNGGVLAVSLEKVDIDTPVNLILNRNLAPGKYILLEVSDTGGGIDLGAHGKIFDPYFTTKPKGEGTGLGLSVVLGIIEKCNGGINVSSEIDKGSSFQVYFPRFSGDKNVSSSVSNITATGHNEHILIVDDEEPICNMLSRMLSQIGYRTTAFTKPLDALQKFNETPELFDLVISDMTMPEMTGRQLAVEILAKKPAMPIILCTGYSELINQEQAIKLGIKGYLMKPVSQNDLSAKIRESLD